MENATVSDLLSVFETLPYLMFLAAVSFGIVFDSHLAGFLEMVTILTTLSVFLILYVALPLPAVTLMELADGSEL
jgi:hypothetical protein